MQKRRNAPQRAIASGPNWQDTVSIIFFFCLNMSQRTFRQLENILLRHRHALGKDNERMDGHGMHTVAESVGFCRDHSIDVCYMPPRTSHIMQPLDVGVFAAYKAAYRRAARDRGIDEMKVSWASEATKNRCKMLDRALIANINSATPFKIRRALYNTGIYPVSIEHFLVKCTGVRDVPAEARLNAKEVVAKEKADRELRLQNGNVRDELL